MRALAILLCVLCGPALAADETPELPALPPPPTLLERLGRPARAEAVDTLLRAHRVAPSGDRVRLATALGVAGGTAAVEGVLVLTRDADPAVRTAAYEALARIGLRSDEVRSAATFALARRGAPERAAVLAALGVSGESTDVDLLLAIAGDGREPPEVRSAAFGALRQISGEAKPYDLERWRVWWAEVRESLQDRLDAACGVFVDDPGARRQAESRLARLAWVAPEVLRRRVTRWLDAEEPEARAGAARLAAALRSLELVRPLAAAFDVPDERADVRAALRGALTLLGAPPDAPGEPTPER
jgi:HEAT repeat protein